MTETGQRPTLLAPRRLVLPLLLIVGLIGFFAAGLDDYLTFAALQDHRHTLVSFAARYGLLANLVYLAVYAVVIAFSLPGGAMMTMVGGFLFGTLLGGTTVVIGATLGATALFVIAKTSFGDPLEARAGPAIKKLEAGFQRNAFSYLLFLRLVPLFPFFVVNLVPAFLGVSLRTYFVTTLVGIIPGTFVYASVGNGLSAVLDAGGTPNLERIFEPDILIPIIGLAVLSLIPVAYNTIRAAKVKADHATNSKIH